MSLLTGYWDIGPCKYFSNAPRVISSVFLSFLFPLLSPAELSSPCQRILRCGHNILVSISLPWLGDYHALQLHSGLCCEPLRSSHGLCRKCSEVSYSISSHELGSFSRFLDLKLRNGIRIVYWWRQNDTHSPEPGPWPGRLVPSSHQRSEFSNTILGTFSRGDKRVWKCNPIPNGLGEKLHL